MPRGGVIERGGLTLDGGTSTKLVLEIGDHKPVKRTLTALTVEDAL